ncbi:MAG: sulfite exporter TauE/SafE family protein [Crocinitomicaceae bacterium]|nr:sulfite exporter TauE/SafE family protein [Crocinitomicaceae bacterium]
MFQIGLFLSLLIGIVLGLVGGGGSILTVPLVNQFFGTSMLIATTYSLFVVAIASGIGVLQRLPKHQIDFKRGIIFAVPSMITAFLIRGFVMPMFPISLAISDWVLSRDVLITILLIVVMFYTAIRTLVGRKKEQPAEAVSTPVGLIVAFGILTGLLSGFIGAGGGFIIVPILLRMGLDMKKAVGTSMLIICIQSAVALMGDFLNEDVRASGAIDWTILLSITGVTVVGVFLGTHMQNYFSAKWLRKFFSLVLIGVAIGLLWKL